MQNARCLADCVTSAQLSNIAPLHPMAASAPKEGTNVHPMAASVVARDAGAVARQAASTLYIVTYCNLLQPLPHYIVTVRAHMRCRILAEILADSGSQRHRPKPRVQAQRAVAVA